MVFFVAPVSHCEKHNRYITRIEAEKARRQDDCLQEVMTDRQSERSTSSLKPGDGVPGALPTTEVFEKCQTYTEKMFYIFNCAISKCRLTF